ncbi:MAG: MBL fold metallo-hydrolase [Phycisphaerales bacterium]|nr:MBL fold metallo-hydrolase [Phycisphaerales bacterium]
MKAISHVRVTMLGTGTSHGVPMIGCDCAVCTSDDPRDRRTRPSITVEFAGKRVLVDTSPELRLQCVANNVNHIDAVLFTHAHADHVTGMDDLRRFNWLCDGDVHCYGSADTLASIRRMFAYIFTDEPEYPSQKPALALHEIDVGVLELFDQRIEVLRLFHGPLPVLGFRFGKIAYCTDCNRIPDETLERLRDLDVLVLDGLRRRPHPTHFNLEQAVEMAQRIAARRTYFTHIAHELPHAATNAELPDGMDLAYDGQVIESAG